MRILRSILAVSLAVMLGACACHTRKVGAGDNIGNAGDNGPLHDVNYAFDSYALDARAKEILKSNSEWLKANPSATAQVEGHCDERGTAEYNMALGAKRAKASANFLHSLGIDSKRLSTVSYGKELPLDPRHNEEAWAKNRRAHFNVKQ